MSRGVLIYAHNNHQIDYTLISLCNGLCIKTHLDVPVCLVTDDDSLTWLRSRHSKDVIDRAFADIIIEKTDLNPKGRKFNDTLSTMHELPWYNTSRSDCYRQTPFDETLLIDSDYLVLDNTLNLVWNSANDVMINRHAIPLDHQPVTSGERWLEHTGIELCWATCVFFRKSVLAERLFDMVEHIRENYEYYSMVYGYSTKLFRNDYIFSIAVHMMSGFTRCNDIPTLPSPFLFSSFDRDELINVPARDELVFLLNDRNENWKFRLTKTKHISVHIMNKFSIVRQADKFIELYR